MRRKKPDRKGFYQQRGDAVPEWLHNDDVGMFSSCLSGFLADQGIDLLGYSRGSRFFELIREGSGYRVRTETGFGDLLEEAKDMEASFYQFAADPSCSDKARPTAPPGIPWGTWVAVIVFLLCALTLLLGWLLKDLGVIGEIPRFGLVIPMIIMFVLILVFGIRYHWERFGDFKE